MSDPRSKLIARRDELIAKINETPGWGAAKSVAYEELQGVVRTLETLAPEPAQNKVKARLRHDKSVEKPEAMHTLIPPEEAHEE